MSVRSGWRRAVRGSAVGVVARAVALGIGCDGGRMCGLMAAAAGAGVVAVRARVDIGVAWRVGT